MLPKYNTGLTADKSGVYGGFGDYQGIDLFIRKDGEFTLFWYAPEGRYYIAHAMPDDKDFIIYTTRGGTFADPASREEYPIGEGSIDMDGGAFYYMTEEHGRGSFAFTQKYLSSEGGAYFQPDKVGSGFSIKRFGATTSCYWYTYLDGKQQWFLCSGDPNAMTIWRFDECRINYPGGVEVECGSAILDHETMHFKYDIGGLKGFQDLVRVF